MKQLIIIQLLLLANSNLHAQPSIDSADMPVNGDTLRYSIAPPDSAVLFNFANTGANQVWVFDSLQANRQGVSEFLSASQAGYNQVPSRIGELLTDTLNLGTISLYDVYNFFKNDSSEYALDYRGFSIPTGFSPPFPTVIRESPSFSDKDEIYQFPLSYQDRDSSTFDFTYVNIIAGIYYSSSGYRINEVEAWGSITTPFGTFNCIKVKTDIVTYDTVSFGATQFGINSHQREYKWLSPQIPIPVANFSGSVMNGVFIPGTIQYRDSVRTGIPNLFAPFVLFDADTTIVNVGDSVFFSNNTLSITPATYQWSVSPASHQYVDSSNANSEEPVVKFNATGFYDVQLIATNSRGSDSLLIPSYIEVRLPVGVNEEKARNKNIRCFPNPLKESQPLKITSDKSLGIIRLYDQQSRLIQSWDAQGRKSLELSLDGLSPGLYFIKIEGENSQLNQKIIVQ